MMPTSPEQLSRLLDAAFGLDRGRQRHALRILTSLASARQTPGADITAIWQELYYHLPFRNVAAATLVDFVNSYEIITADKRAKRLTNTLYRPLLEAIAANPSTPPVVLSKIAYYAPQALCKNPALSRLIETTPDWIFSLCGKALGEQGNVSLMRILRCRNAPRSLVEPIAAGKIPQTPLLLLQEEAERHVSLVGEADSETWIEEINDYWRRYASRSEGQADLAIAGLLPAWAYGEDAAGLRNAQARFQRALDPEIPLEECLRLIQQEDFPVIRLAALVNPVLPEAERHRISKLMFRHTDYIVPVLRAHGRPKTAKDVLAICQEILIKGDTPLLSFGSYLWGNRLLDAFLRIKTYPHLVSDPLAAQQQGEYWVVLLAWALGIRPNTSEGWGVRQKRGLVALAEDGNRWVSAAARARLQDPSVTLGW